MSCWLILLYEWDFGVSKVRKQYVSEGIKYDFMVDKTSMKLMNKTAVGLRAGGLAFKKNGTHRGKHFIYGQKDFYICKRESGKSSYYQVIKYLHFNPNDDARAYCRKKMPDVWPTLSRSTYSHELNFIPSGILLNLPTDLSVSKIRSMMLNRLWKKIDAQKEECASQLTELLGQEFKKDDFDVFIDYMEICFDLVLPVRVALPTIDEIHNGMNRSMSSLSPGYFKNGKKYGCRIDQLKLHYGDDEKPIINFTVSMGKFVCSGRLYIKEEGQFGTMNRFELAFLGTDLKGLCSSYRPADLDELLVIINLAAEYTFELLYEVAAAPFVKEGQDWKMLESLLKMIFPKYWHFVLPVIRHSPTLYSTGMQLPKSVKNMLPKFAKAKVLFKKGSRRAQFSVDWANLNRASQNFARFKFNQKQKNKRTKINGN